MRCFILLLALLVPTAAGAQEMQEMPPIYRAKHYQRAIDKARRQAAKKDAKERAAQGRQIERIGSKSARGPNLTREQQAGLDRLNKVREQAAKDCEERMKQAGARPAVIADAGVEIDQSGKGKLSLGGSKREAQVAARMRKCPEFPKEDKEAGKRLAEDGKVEVRRAFVIDQPAKRKRSDDSGPVQPGPQ